MKFFYSDIHDLALPDGHRFPGHKYGMLRQALIDNGVIDPHMLCVSPIAPISQIALAHDEEYIEAIETGTIDATAMRRIGFPWSKSIATRSRATCGGAIAAARSAIEFGFSAQLAGGTHHAHRDFGSGYCVFNDFAVTALSLLQEKLVTSIAIIDLDVHQGDGNAAILGGQDDVFILSVHGAKNFPFKKYPSTLDIALPDGISDGAYLEALTPALDRVWGFAPDLILYQAGVDPLESDKLGRMNLSFDGLMARDRLVFNGAQSRNIPVSLGIGGGYADPIEMSIEAYVNSFKVAKEIYGWESASEIRPGQ